MTFRNFLIFSVATAFLSVTNAQAQVISAYLGFKSNPVDVTFDSGKKGDTPAGTKVEVIYWSMSYTSDYIKDIMSSATKEDKKTLKHSKEANACLNNDPCKEIIKKYDEGGMVMQSYVLRAEHGKIIEKNSLVKILNGPFKGKNAWVDDSDLYFKP